VLQQSAGLIEMNAGLQRPPGELIQCCGQLMIQHLPRNRHPFGMVGTERRFQTVQEFLAGGEQPAAMPAVIAKRPLPPGNGAIRPGIRPPAGSSNRGKTFVWVSGSTLAQIMWEIQIDGRMHRILR